jgi:hypothetical protein
MTRATQQALVGIKLPNLAEKANSPDACLNLVLWEGTDHYEDLFDYIGGVADQLHKWHKAKEITIDLPDGTTRVVPIRVVGGGDMAFVRSVLGMDSNYNTWPCPYCEIPKAQLNSTDLDLLKGMELRTLHRLGLLSHTALGQCPACKEHVTEPANHTDASPPGFAKSHFGIKYGHTPLVRIEPLLMISCVLHLLLRIVSSLHTKVTLELLPKNASRASEQIRKDLLSFYRDKARIAIKESQTGKGRCGIYLRKKKTRNTKQKQNKRSKEKQTLHGLICDLTFLCSWCMQPRRRPPCLHAAQQN